MDTDRRSRDVPRAREGEAKRRSRRGCRLAIVVALLSAVLLVTLSSTAAAVTDIATRYEESDGRLQYSPSWPSSTYYLYSGGHEKYTYARGGCVYIPFWGVGLDWIAKTGPQMGIALVSVDGGAAVQVDLYSASTKYKVKVWSTGNLGRGVHWVKIARSGTKNPNSTGTALTLDAVDVRGTLAWATRYQETDPLVEYSFGWAINGSWNYSGGTMKSFNPVLVPASAPPAVSGGPSTAAAVQPDGFLFGSATVDFDGIRLNLVCTKSRYSGKAWVSVDGGPRVLVDLYSYTTKYKQTVYSTGFLTPGAHTVTISFSSLKNYYSKGYSINVDAFDIIGTLGQGGT
jgi:hypothetical protein